MTLLDPRRHALRVVSTATPQPTPPPAPSRIAYGGAVIRANGGAGCIILPGATRAQRAEVAAWLLAEDGRAP